MSSYTLYSHSPDESNFCIANMQVREDSTGEIVIERTVDSSTEELYVANVQQLLSDFQARLPKGMTVTLNIVNLNEQGTVQ